MNRRREDLGDAVVHWRWGLAFPSPPVVGESREPYRAAAEAGEPRKPYTVAYEPPEYVHDPRPRVIFWYRAYAAVMLLASLALLGFATLLAWAQTRPEIAMMPGTAAAQTNAIIFFLLSAAGVAFYGVATFMPFKPWAWTLGLLVIALGVPGLTIVVCLPLLLAWLKPTVKAAFCRL